MPLIIFNGSPRGKNSNTTLLMNQFIAGYTHGKDNQAQVQYLIHTKDADKNMELFRDAGNVIIAFPLYTDAMPGIVKHFIEALQPLCGRTGNPRLGFVVQSGFPEPHHSRFVEAYLQKLAKRLGCEYLGTIVKGGVEGIQMMPPNMTKKLFKTFYDLGVFFAQYNAFSSELLRELTPRENMSLLRRSVFRILNFTGLTNFYWNMHLKKNNAWDKRFDRPFA